jgi:hypothetical protein
MPISRMLMLRFGGQESNAWPPAIIIYRVNNRISKTSASVAEISYIMLKIKTPKLLSELKTHGTVV